MIILTPLSIILGLTATAISIIEFFLLVRLVMLFHPVKWLTSFDYAGQRLVTDSMKIVQRIWNRIGTKPLSQKGQIIIGLIVLEMLRAIIYGISGCL